MGAGGSTLEAEKAKPADGRDIDTPRGQSAKKEVLRLRRLIAKLETDGSEAKAPGFIEYAEGLFKKADKDGSGNLSSDEFWSLIKSELHLDLSEEQIKELSTKGDLDVDGQVSFKEFQELVPTLLIKVADKASEAPVEDQWVELENDNGVTFFYNKKIQQTTWEKQEPMAPDLKDYLKRVFDAADTDGSGVLSKDEFYIMIRDSLQLGLSEEEIEKIQSSSDFDVDGEVSWAEFTVIGPQLLKDIYETQDASARDWCTLKSDSGAEYYYNKRTGESVWEKPNEMVNEEASHAYTNMNAGLQTFLNQWFTSADTDGSGVLTKEQFTSLLAYFKLSVDDAQVDELLAANDYDADGVISWSEFVVSVPGILQRACSETEASRADWCELNTLNDEGITVKSYYNYRTQDWREGPPEQ